VGWYPADEEAAKRLLYELHRELRPDHPLYGIELEACAHRDGATDDVLFRHSADPGRFTVVHLTWLEHHEIDANHPGIEFDGTFDAFLAYERDNWGLEPPGEE
jgi:hypothetical protein